MDEIYDSIIDYSLNNIVREMLIDINYH